MFGITTYKIIMLIWLIAKVHSDNKKYTFRCKNGNYILDNAFCWGPEGHRCQDDSDKQRSKGCNWDRCGGGARFWCDGACHYGVSMRCNTIRECNDGSDEYDCGDEVNVDNCSLRVGKFLCDDGLRCLNAREMCNGYCQCFDCSDEKSGCSSDREIEEMERKYESQACFKTPNGPHCSTALNFDTTFQKCTRDQQNQCEQKCVRLDLTSRCLCDENYIGVPGTNNKYCNNNEEASNTFIYASQKVLGRVDFSTNITQVIKKDIEVTAIAGAHDYIYYATYDKEDSSGHIFRISTISSQTQEIIYSDSKINSLAIDWITNQTYYSNKNDIVACSKDSELCKPVKSSYSCSIGLAPRFGLMFWVEIKDQDLSSQYITKSAMDGSGETLLTVRVGVPWEISITVDELTEKVYFWTGLVELSFISFDGQYQHEFQPTTFSPNHMGIFTTFDRKIFYSTHKLHQIYAGDISSRLLLASLLVSFPKSTVLKHLHMYNPRLQHTMIPNPCEESCTENGTMCLLRPSSSRSELNYTCFNNIEVVKKRPNSKHNTAANSSSTSNNFALLRSAYLPPLDTNSNTNPANSSQPTPHLNSMLPTQAAFTSDSVSNFTASKSSFHSNPDSDSGNHFLTALFTGIIAVCATVGVMMLLIRYMPTLFTNIQSSETEVPLESRKNQEPLIDVNESAGLNALD